MLVRQPELPALLHFSIHYSVSVSAEHSVLVVDSWGTLLGLGLLIHSTTFLDLVRARKVGQQIMSFNLNHFYCAYI